MQQNSKILDYAYLNTDLITQAHWSLNDVRQYIKSYSTSEEIKDDVT